jgi:hypothetical protein
MNGQANGQDPDRRRDWPIVIRPLHDPEADARDVRYWMSRPPHERLDELDRLRNEVDGPQPRLARVAVVLDLKTRRMIGSSGPS